MAQQAPPRSKFPTKSPQPARGRASSQAKSGRTAPGRMLASGAGRAATRGGGPVIELDCGITVYPAREEQGRWRAVWHENGVRQQCEAASEEKLAAKLAKVTERLEADAPNMTLRGADLIAFYLSAGELRGRVGVLGRPRRGARRRRRGRARPGARRRAARRPR